MSPTPFELPAGDAQTLTAVRYPANATVEPLGLLVLAHGAGAGQSHPFMVTYASGLAARGLHVVTFDFPYMRARRRAPDRAPVLEEAFRHAVAGALAQPRADATRLFIGGKSMGGRIAVRLAASPETWPASLPALDGVIAFGYPLTPPGGVIGDRASHFATLQVPALIVQGTRDSFGGPDDIRRVAPDVTVHAVNGGDHSFAVRKSAGVSQQAVHDGILDAVIAWIRSRRSA